MGSPCSGDIEEIVIAMNDENSPGSVDVFYIVEVGGDLVRNKVLSKITQPRLFSKNYTTKCTYLHG